MERPTISPWRARGHAFLTLNAFIEEGFPTDQLERIVGSLAEAAAESGVAVCAGDTKVLRRGEGGGIYFATTGVGTRMPGARPALSNIRDGDVVLVSGPIGDHGTAVMLAREDFGLRGDLQSDAASVLPLAEALVRIDGLRFMRDPTRWRHCVDCPRNPEGHRARRAF